jgi:alpha-tubulin suppressor-like RCC1 family protein
VKQVSTSNHISFAVTGSHCVYTWGSSGKGPMALYKQQRANFQSPQLIESLQEEDIVDVAVGLNHACARNEIAVYSWGCGTSGCLGNDNTKIQELPDLISFETHEVMSSIVSGEMHCAALSESGKVWTWGVGANGRLGLGNLTGFGFVPLPKEIKLSFQIVMISCGSEHTLASTHTNIFSWGANDGARLGHGDCKDRYEPCEIVRMSGLTILDISCGTWHTACIAASPPMQNCGWLYTW